MCHVVLGTSGATNFVGIRGNVECMPVLGHAIYLHVTQFPWKIHHQWLESHVGNFVDLLGEIAGILVLLHVTLLFHAPIQDVNC